MAQQAQPEKIMGGLNILHVQSSPILAPKATAAHVRTNWQFSDLVYAGALTNGIVITERYSPLIFVNRTATEIIAEADGLRVESIGVAAHRVGDTKATQHKIAAR